MAPNGHPAKISIWSRVGMWLSRQVYPYYVPAQLRATLQRVLASNLAVLRARTAAYGDDAWQHLSALLHREVPITDFGSFIEILELELRIAGIGFTARTTDRGTVLCGRGWGGYVHIDELGKALGEIDAWGEDRASRQTQSNADAEIEAFVAVLVAAGDAARTQAFDAVANLEARTLRVVDTVTKARAILQDVAAREIDSQGAFDIARLGRSDADADTHVKELDADLADLRLRAASVRSAINDALVSLSPPQAAASRLLDDAAISEEWRRVVVEAETVGLPFEEISSRLKALRAWHLTPWQEHPDKRELFQRLNRQLVVARQLGAADHVP